MEKHILNSNIFSIKLPWLRSFIKRLFDIVVSVIFLLFLGPVFTLIAIAIKRDSPGPVFYHGRRMGRWGKPFLILKFRTMYEDPKSYRGPKVTGHNDTRITPLGKWLRNTKINEMPQFWNVLKGEMSLVGPRPERPHFVEQFKENHSLSSSIEISLKTGENVEKMFIRITKMMLKAHNLEVNLL